ncbi:hypothetical protein KR093_000199 [Drosophila rubida]|uniref:Uncharacterized protein n=1 Tax=Drosophila rubida TaxID=30044 RepID=A0AAD4JZ79_9MUSC|nr:hypothetical protein KR093_000199 [Drosophila rubida]
MSEELSDATANEMEIAHGDEEDSFWDAFDNDSLLNSEKADEPETANGSQGSSENSQSVEMLTLVQERVSHMKSHFSYITGKLKQMLHEQQVRKLKTREIVDKYDAVKYSQSGGDIASSQPTEQCEAEWEPSEEPEFIMERIGDAVGYQHIGTDPYAD